VAPFRFAHAWQNGADEFDVPGFFSVAVDIRSTKTVGYLDGI
jgi:hypothetical protein